ncbi:hypothetical protein FB45DRAFT_1040408 [Roridomyces roridus]|uniref:Uncharacterized protein n=1 Tax=Roridomyces roridus TaxID=1738132 RepID=A0AAD7B0T2_9AGAR|nr:hypothetical protein FB45DRAFT_1040408 [Roridomyces roridus]
MGLRHADHVAMGFSVLLKAFETVLASDRATHGVDNYSIPCNTVDELQRVVDATITAAAADRAADVPGPAATPVAAAPAPASTAAAAAEV